MSICRFIYDDIIVSRGVDYFAKRTMFENHTHTGCEVFYFMSGKATYHVEGSEYELCEGDVLIMRPGESHCVEIIEACNFDRTSVTFDKLLFDCIDTEQTLLKTFFDRKAGTKNHYKNTDFYSDEYKKYFENMMDKSTNRLNIIGNMILLLQEMNKAFENQQHNVNQNRTEYQIIQYINKNLDKDLTIEKLSSQFFISSALLCKMFKKSTGISVGKYITKKRLLRARELLLKGEKPTDIYEWCGYKDYSVFYRAFVKEYGCSPTKRNEKFYRVLDFEKDTIY